MPKLSGRRIVLTGVSRGVGFEIAKLFLSEGAAILGVARDSKRLERVGRNLDPSGVRMSVLQGDVVQPDTAARIARAAEQRWGALDVLFNNAGVQLDEGTQGISECSDSTLQESLQTNFLAPYRLVKACLPLLLEGNEPRIVNVSSGAGNFESMRALGIPSYRLTKWALNGLTMLLSAELAGRVAVNAFDPGWVKTDMGGENAPGLPTESAQGALSLLTLPFSETGKFYKDGSEIPF